MLLTVKSDHQLYKETDLKHIHDIFEESDCPYESLCNTFAGSEVSYDNDANLITIGNDPKYTYQVEVE